MSILNITPDSFFAPSRTGISGGELIDRAGRMLEEGAKILDVGGMSSRPGAKEIGSQEELDRVIPAVEVLHNSFPEAIISVDSYRSEVAGQAIHAGATMVNDISGGSLDPGMIDLLASSEVAYVMMHMRGNPADMQTYTDYDDLIRDLVSYFVNKLRIFHHRGIRDIIIDPGFGFSKTVNQNFEIIRQLRILNILECPVLIGLSRKSSLGQVIKRPVEETLFATTALHMAALEGGASILRVHDVKPAMDAIAIFNKLQEAKNH
ncbi:MAG: dihydropteroate synthase [Saprospiraceae bacterium]|uniref:dihydropteroate synthase n=1 Tax=Candidatus Opimibacter skivensis TaxID=2982028 RepID=A0A9D7XUS2_9BACT|nr:dihydropteroate synthase [Candidatus Opimibacter skivensis]